MLLFSIEMNFSRYKFSKECETNLFEFLNVVRAQKGDTKSNELWNKFAPADLDIHKLIGNETTAMEICAVSPNEALIGELPGKNCDQSALLADSLSKMSLEDWFDYVAEILSSEKVLLEYIIKKLHDECGELELRELFKLFSKKFNMDSIYQLGHSLCLVKSTESNNLASFFCDNILLFKDNGKQGPLWEKLLVEFFDSFPDELHKLLNTFQKNDMYTFESSVKVLSASHKQNLLREYASSLQKLTDYDLEVITNLLTPQLELPTLQNIVKLMSNSADDFSKKKTYGKLLNNIIPVCGRHIIHFETDFNYILTKHQTIWKNQAQKALSARLDYSHRFSQSLV